MKVEKVNYARSVGRRTEVDLVAVLFVRDKFIDTINSCRRSGRCLIRKSKRPRNLVFVPGSKKFKIREQSKAGTAKCKNLRYVAFGLCI